MLIAGIDGCGPNWLAIAHEPGSKAYTATVLSTAELVMQDWRLAAIDIPIGLPGKGPRAADLAARKFIKPRHNSVFPTPIRPALQARTWTEACAITRLPMHIWY